MRHDRSDNQGNGESSSDGSLHRRPFLGALGTLGLTAGIAGRVGAQDGSEWPDGGDDYYQGLADELEALGVPAGEFVYGDNESDVRTAYWEDAGDDGTVEDLDVTEDNVPFTEASRFDITEEPSNNWDVQILGDTEYRAIDEGDVMLGVAYLRAPEGQGTATAQYVADNPNSEGWNDVVSDDYQQPPGEWQRYFFPIEFGADAAIDEWYTQFYLGFDSQVIDVGGLALLDFGQDAQASALPSGTLDEEYEYEESSGDGYDSWEETTDEYYSGLIEHLQGEDVPPGHFIYADNEADTYANYEVAGSHADIATSTSINVSDNDVPFSEAIHIEVGETDDSIDPWAVNFNAPVEGTDISSGDVLLGVAYLRTQQIGGSTADVTFKTTSEGNEADNYALNGSITVGQEWERFFFPIEYQADAAAGEWWTEFWVGIEGQTVDIGGIAIFDFAQGVDANELPSWDDDISPPSGWESDRDDAIQQHRTSNGVTLEVLDENGEPIADTEIDVEMLEHEFNFGTAVDAERLLEGGTDASEYRDKIPELFNTTVLENYHKWQFWEERRNTADDATDRLLKAGLNMRGHVAIWANRGSWSIPSDVEDAMDAGDAETVRQRSLDHIETIIDYYGDDMDSWDVVNEVRHETEMIEVIEGDDVDPLESDILAEWYRTATDAAPEGVDLDVNDYNTLVGPYENVRSDYERQISFLADAEGVDLGGIGMQSHFSRSEILMPSDILDTFDRYNEAGNGAALRITEFDMADPNWPEEDKAEFFHWMLKTVYSHPDAEDFIIWGFWDGEHWEDDAPLFYEDWEPKPSYDVWMDLVFDEWWTEELGVLTDETGEYTLEEAYHGEYTVTVTVNGTELVDTVTISDADGETLEVVPTEPENNNDGGNDDDDDDEEEEEEEEQEEEENEEQENEESQDEDDEDADEQDDAADDEESQDQAEDDEDADTDDTDTSAADGSDDDSVPGLGIVSGLAGLGAAAGHLLSKASDSDESGGNEGA